MNFTIFTTLAFTLLSAASFAQPATGSDLYPVVDHGLWGYINQDGKLIIKPQYQQADYFYEGLAAVKKNNKWGFVDSRNRMIIEPQTDTVLHFSEGWCAVGNLDAGLPMQWNYIDAKGQSLQGNEIPGLGFATNFGNNRAMVSEQGFDEPFIISRQGRRVIKQGDYYFFTDADNSRFTEGILKVMKPAGAAGLYQTVFIDTAGRILPQYAADYPATGGFHEGMMWFYKDMKYGFLDHSGHEVIKAQYDTVMDFSEGLACVWQKMNYNPNNSRLEGGVSGYINPLGEWVLEPKERQSYSFHDGLARVLEKGKWGYMNTTGVMVVPADYDEAQDYFRGFARVKKDGLWYYLNTSGKAVWQQSKEQ